jgi:hypothetical protein
MSAARSGWRRRVVAAFTQNIALKASAVLLAIALWFVVAAREPTEEVVGVRFVPVLDSSLVLRDPPPAIRALVIGRANEVLKLSTNPLVIRRTVASDVPDTLVVSLRASDVEVPEGVEVLVRDLEPRAMTLTFEATANRVVPVRSALVTARVPGTVGALPLARARLEPESVTIAGPRRTVTRVRFVNTVADTISPYDTIPHLVDVDTARLGVTVRPPQIKATLTHAVVRRAPPASPPVPPRIR